MAIQETLVLVKPDGVARNLTGEILRRIEAKGYSLVDIKLVEADRELLAAHYAEHEGKPFYEPLLEFMSSGAVTAAVIEGHRCIEGFRALAGATDPTAALPGTIRGDLGRDSLQAALAGGRLVNNLVHTSDDPDAARRDFGTWYGARRRGLLTPPDHRPPHQRAAAEHPLRHTPDWRST